MSGHTEIGWTDMSWNPLLGCRKVSPGCLHCYSETMSCRLARMALAKIAKGEDPGRLRHYVDIVDLETGRFNGRVVLVPEALGDPLKWKKPRMVFVNSMSDLFHEDVPPAFISQVFEAMNGTPRHIYQILTKRPENMLSYLRHQHRPDPEMVPLGAHVWLGTSVENRQHGLPRIDILRQVPAAVRFLSIEPLLEDLGELDLEGIDWVIVGGESGPGARPFDPDWARSIRDQCAAAEIPFFMKQITVRGRKIPYDEWSSRGWGDLKIREMPGQPTDGAARLTSPSTEDEPQARLF